MVNMTFTRACLQFITVVPDARMSLATIVGALFRDKVCDFAPVIVSEWTFLDYGLVDRLIITTKHRNSIDSILSHLQWIVHSRSYFDHVYCDRSTSTLSLHPNLVDIAATYVYKSSEIDTIMSHKYRTSVLVWQYFQTRECAISKIQIQLDQW